MAVLIGRLAVFIGGMKTTWGWQIKVDFSDLGLNKLWITLSL